MMLPLRPESADRSSRPPQGWAFSADREPRIVGAVDFQMLKARQCSATLLQEIGHFLSSQDTSHPFQSAQWAVSGTRLALLRIEGRLRWLAQCGELYPAGRFLPSIRALTVNHGPVCDDLSVMQIGLRRLVEQSRKMGACFIDITPEWWGAPADALHEMLARNGWRVPGDRRSSLRLDLTPTLEHLLAGFRDTTRYKIRRAQRNGVEVTIARDAAECRQFLRLHSEMASRQGFAIDDGNFAFQVLCWLTENPSLGGVFLARENGALQGGIVVVRSGFRCWYIWGATLKEHKVNVGHLLQWRAIEWAKQNGCAEYDFCGFREGASSGPAFFKRGFCDCVVHFLPRHRFVISARRYRIVELISRVRHGFREPVTPAIEVHGD